MNSNAASPYQLLIVDDEPEVVEALRRQLRDWARNNRIGMITASNAADARQMIEDSRNQIAVLLSDNRMPGMTGSELIHLLVREKRRTVPMLITGYTEAHEIQAAQSVGVFSLLVKPWNKGELVQEVDSALAAYRGRTRMETVESRKRQEFRIARLLHDSVIDVPDDVTHPRGRISCARRTVGAAGITGDIFDIVRVDADRHLVVIGELSVKDLRSVALAAVIARSTRMIASGDDSEARLASPREYLHWLNGLLAPVTAHATDLFFTGTAFLVDFRHLTVDVASAGGPFLVYLSPDQEVREIPLVSDALGVQDNPDIGTYTVPLEAGSRLFACTDGLGRTDVIAPVLAEEVSRREDGVSVEELLIQIRRRNRFRPFRDDVTFVEVCVSEEE